MSRVKQIIGTVWHELRLNIWWPIIFVAAINDPPEVVKGAMILAIIVSGVRGIVGWFRDRLSEDTP